jgi:hypothetical protein
MGGVDDDPQGSSSVAAIYGELAETLRRMADEPHAPSPHTQRTSPPPRVPRLEKAAAAYRNALALDHTQVREATCG